MIRSFMITEEALKALFNPQGHQILTAEGWPEKYRIVDVKYNGFENHFEFAVDDLDEHSHDLDLFKYVTPRYMSIVACPRCHELFGKTAEEIN